MTTFYPIKSDSRYSIAKEFCGYPEKRFVLRYCGEFVAQSLSYSAMVVRAVGHKAVASGALVIEGKAA
jgi:hypothetical protein